MNKEQFLIMWLGIIVVIVLSAYLPYKAEENFYENKPIDMGKTNLLSYAWVGSDPYYKQVTSKIDGKGDEVLIEEWQPYVGACSVDVGRYLASVVPVLLVTGGLMLTVGREKKNER